MLGAAVLLLALGWSAGPACSSDNGPDCSAKVDLSCTPAYDPTFENLFQNTLHGSCALTGTSCHAPAGQSGGVNFGDADSAYRTLVDQQKVLGGRPQCSPMVHRIISSDPAYQMPPGKPLTPSEQCAVIQWINAGAKR
jgi:hypothetical protein